VVVHHNFPHENGHFRSGPDVPLKTSPHPLGAPGEIGIFDIFPEEIGLGNMWKMAHLHMIHLLMFDV